MTLRTCLAVSSFKADASVLELLARAAEDGALNLFDRVLVVDSIGTGTMRAQLENVYGSRVEYHCFEDNLGSAGNLAKRLLIAAEDCDVVYAVNHDGSVELNTIMRLLEVAEQNTAFGALYPLRQLSSRNGEFDLSGQWSIPVPTQTSKEPPPIPLARVHWSSSNPALYSLKPVRAGLLPWAELWMGWEDLGYGWLLSKHKYPQYIVTDAVTVDGYELRAVATGVAYVSEKPAWYSYYTSRNLLLIAQRLNVGALRTSAIFGRIALEAVVTITVRPNSAQRLLYLAHGFADGLRGRSGKWRVP